MKSVEIDIVDQDGSPLNYTLKWDNCAEKLRIIIPIHDTFFDDQDDRYSEAYDEGYEAGYDAGLHDQGQEIESLETELDEIKVMLEERLRKLT